MAVQAGSPRRLHPKEFNSWKAMLARCRFPSNPSYRYCGAKGIKVCPAWQESFWSFLADMGPAPGPRHTIDRIDNERGYEKANCRWATPAEQQRNTCKCLWITCNGLTLCLADWSLRTGIPHSTLSSRIHKLGLSPEEAVTTPLSRRHSKARRAGQGRAGRKT